MSFSDPSSEAISCENIQLEDAPEDILRMKGDAIGDTLYSERWVLKLLIKLSELTSDSWNSDLEQDLCLLWDMTAEKDVVLFLIDHDFFDLFCKVISVLNEARCIEIMVGIIGNLTCVDQVIEKLAQHEAAIVLINLITSEDSLILVQLLRVLNSCLWRERLEMNSRSSSPIQNQQKSPSSPSPSSPSSPWLTVLFPLCELLLRHVGFFLSSATNEDLLCSSLEFLDTLLKIPALNLTPVLSTSTELASGLAECLRQLLRGVKTGDSVTENKRLCKAYEFWLSVVGVVASCQEGRTNLSAFSDTLTKCFTKLVLLFTTPEALKTQDPEMALLCLSVLETVPTSPVSPPVLGRLIGVLCNLTIGTENSSHNSEESFQLKHLQHRILQFVRLRLEEADDLVPIIQTLSTGQIQFLESALSSDEILCERIERCLIQIRTNGLVQ